MVNTNFPTVNLTGGNLLRVHAVRSVQEALEVREPANPENTENSQEP